MVNAHGTLTVGEFLFQHLSRTEGLKYAFGLPGDFALPLFSCIDRSPIELVTMTHEPGVGFAADAYARTHGLGLALVTYGVGGLNMVNSIGCAYAEKSPVIVVSGSPSLTERSGSPLVHHTVKSFDSQRKIFQEITCADTVLLDPDTAADEIIRVIDAVLARRRPGYIEIPSDIVNMPARPPSRPRAAAPRSNPEKLAVCVSEAIEFINSSEQPVLLAGVELHRHKLTDFALEIADKVNIAVASTLLSKSVVGETHPRHMGVYSGALSHPDCQKHMERSDCVIMLGTLLSDILYCGDGGGGNALAHKNSILATTDRIQVGHHRYDDVLFEDFVRELAGSDSLRARPSFSNPNPASPELPINLDEREDPLDIESAFRIIGLHLGDDSTVISDTGDALLGAIDLRPAKRQEFLSPAHYLTMGFAIPAAVGIMADNPHKRVFVLLGDGAFQMTGMELSVAAKRGMTPIVVIFNNDGYGTQRKILDGPFNDIHGWDYTKIVELLGYGQAVTVNTKGQLDYALADAIQSGSMCVIEVKIPRDSHSRALRRLGEELGKLRNS